jgi:hypothetical protein
MNRCIHCCRRCGSHFSSLAAWEAHRSGPFDGERVCWSTDRELPLRRKTESGVCDLVGMTQIGVVIWEHGPSADRARDRYPEALEGPQGEPPNVRGVSLRRAVA